EFQRVAPSLIIVPCAVFAAGARLNDGPAGRVQPEPPLLAHAAAATEETEADPGPRNRPRGVLPGQLLTVLDHFIPGLWCPAQARLLEHFDVPEHDLPALEERHAGCLAFEGIDERHGVRGGLAWDEGILRRWIWRNKSCLNEPLHRVGRDFENIRGRVGRDRGGQFAVHIAEGLSDDGTLHCWVRPAVIRGHPLVEGPDLREPAPEAEPD